MRFLNREKKTICALSTPRGLGGIGVIRVSGPQAISLVKKLCPFLPREVESHRAYFGSLYKGPQCLDEVLVTCFKQGKSYTGEETVEISCHGGPVILSQVLKALLELGIRLADKGEFTYRAFMSGRLDLVQAESVLSLIESRTEKEAQQALKHLKGEFSQKIEKIETKLTQILAQIEASIDYSHEDIKTITPRQLRENLKELEQEITMLTTSYKTGESLKKRP